MTAYHNKYCPYKYKYELVEWFSKRYRESKYKASKRSKKQLYWFYYNTP